MCIFKRKKKNIDYDIGYEYSYKMPEHFIEKLEKINQNEAMINVAPPYLFYNPNAYIRYYKPKSPEEINIINDAFNFDCYFSYEDINHWIVVSSVDAGDFYSSNFYTADLVEDLINNMETFISKFHETTKIEGEFK